MMAQVYIDAVVESRRGKPQYILRKGAYTVRHQSGKEMLSDIRQGYTLQGRYIGGICYSDWDLDVEHQSVFVAECIHRALNKPEANVPANRVAVAVREYYNEPVTQRERLDMTVTIWRDNYSVSENITPSPANSSPEAFAHGQKQAQTILDILQIFHCHQTSELIMRKLESDLISTSRKEFIDDVLNAVHNATLESNHPVWEDFCVELSVPENIAKGYELVVWGEENDAEERYFSVWCFWNNRKDSFTVYSDSTSDTDLIAALEAAVLRLTEKLRTERK